MGTFRRSNIRLAIISLLLLPPIVHAQVTPASPPPDLLVFVNGEQLTGTLTSANSDGIIFASLMAGHITAKWANIKELTSSKQFAVITKNVKLNQKDAAALVPQGAVHMQDGNLTISTSAGPRTEPVADATLLVDAPAFDKAVNHRLGLLEGWGGSATGGVSLVRSTQDSTTFNGGISLIRSAPTVPWLPARDRSLINYNQSYGTTSQAGTPTLLSNIFHANAERDQYFSPRLYAFGSTTFDHNFSQALNLQQAYGAGVGITLLKSGKQTLDFKGDIHYEEQAFFVPAQNQNIFGSTFSETWLRHLIRGLVFDEFGSVSPAWNQSQDFSAHINASLIFPVYKGFAFNVGAVDDYLNNAPVGSNENSAQFTTGITYTIKPRY